MNSQHKADAHSHSQTSMTYLLRKLCPSLANNQTAYPAGNAGGKSGNPVLYGLAADLVHGIFEVFCERGADLSAVRRLVMFEPRGNSVGCIVIHPDKFYRARFRVNT